MASGAAKIKLAGKDLVAFEASLTAILQDLAIQIARDGEGAKKLVTIDVAGAKSEAEAVTIGRAIANSPLVKTAIAGADPNWGRIICAAGYSGANFDPTKVEIAFQGVPVCKNGLAVDFDEAALGEKLNESDIHIRFRIQGTGKGVATFWTCDLTHGYIDINGSYRT
jgi:glutamate N-acetyltransferase/amino-acid N-acetyltransferase